MADEVAKLLEHADVLLLQAGLAPETTRQAILIEARDLLITVEQKQAGAGAYRMAQISAIENKAALCRKWLERADAANALPTRETIESATPFGPWRKQKWFKAILAELD